jgi:hypothetical protein
MQILLGVEKLQVAEAGGGRVNNVVVVVFVRCILETHNIGII